MFARMLDLRVDSCDRFAKHASLTGNGVTTHTEGMKAARWLVADRKRVCLFGEMQVSFLSSHLKQHTIGAMFLIRAVYLQLVYSTEVGT